MSMSSGGASWNYHKINTNICNLNSKYFQNVVKVEGKICDKQIGDNYID